MVHKHIQRDRARGFEQAATQKNGGSFQVHSNTHIHQQAQQLTPAEH